MNEYWWADTDTDTVSLSRKSSPGGKKLQRAVSWVIPNTVVFKISFMDSPTLKTSTSAGLSVNMLFERSWVHRTPLVVVKQFAPFRHRSTSLWPQSNSWSVTVKYHQYLIYPVLPNPAHLHEFQRDNQLLSSLSHVIRSELIKVTLVVLETHDSCTTAPAPGCITSPRKTTAACCFNTAL